MVGKPDKPAFRLVGKRSGATLPRFPAAAAWKVMTSLNYNSDCRRVSIKRKYKCHLPPFHMLVGCFVRPDPLNLHDGDHPAMPTLKSHAGGGGCGGPACIFTDHHRFPCSGILLYTNHRRHRESENGGNRPRIAIVLQGRPC